MRGRTRAWAGLLVLTIVLSVSAALAGPGVAATPTPTPAPKASLTDEEMAERVIKDPRLSREIFWRNWWHNYDGYRNVAPLWFDGTMIWAAIEAEARRKNADLDPEVLEKLLDELWERFVDELTRDAGELTGRVLTYDQAPELFDALGFPRDKLLIEVASINVPAKKKIKVDGIHSEVRDWRHLQTAIQGYSSAPVLGLGKKAVQTLMHAAKVGGESSRSYCEECAALLEYDPAGGTSFDKNSVSIADYLTSLDKKMSQYRVKNVIEKAASRLREIERAQAVKTTEAVAEGPNAKHEDIIARGKAQQAKRDAEQAKKGGGCGGPPPAPPAPPAPQAPAVGLGGGGVGHPGAVALRAASSCGTAGGLLRAVAGQGGPDAYGGVDFSSLQLRYVSTGGSDGVRYAFSATRPQRGYWTDPSYAGSVVRATGDDLRTWLVLDPTAFWVNLNLNEPDRITDPDLGKTHAGRVLLEADLQLKRTSSRLVDPNSPTGRRYWAEMSAQAGSCSVSRMWIVPGKVEVREDGDSLYVLKAPLDVKTEGEHPTGKYADFCGDAAPADAKRVEDIERRIILPELVTKVNTAPEYAALRRTFVTRVVAEWLRTRHAQGHSTGYDDVIDSHDLGPSVLTDGWRPRKVFDDYTKAANSKEFSYTQQFSQGGRQFVREIVTGGVDLTKVPSRAIDAAAMSREYPKLPGTVRAALGAPAAADDGSLWLGGTVPEREPGAWSKVTGKAKDLTAGTGAVAAIIVAALLLLLVGFRGPRRKVATPPAP